MNFQNPASAAWLNVAFLTFITYNPVYITKEHVGKGLGVKGFAQHSGTVVFLKSDAWTSWL